MQPITQTETNDQIKKTMTIKSNSSDWQHQTGVDYDIYTMDEYKVHFIYPRKGKTQAYMTVTGKGGRTMAFPGDILPLNDNYEFVRDPSGTPNRYKPRRKVKETVEVPTPIPTLPSYRVRIQSKERKFPTRDLIKVKIHLPNGCVITANVSQQYASNIIYGRTQSGKTEETVISMVQRMVLDKCTGLYICRDYKSELDDQTEVMREKIQELVGDQIEVVPITGSTGWDALIHSMKTGDNTKFYIVMANSTVTNKIFSAFSNGDEIKFTCALDEADMYIKDGSSQINTDLKLLLSGAIRKYFISATILDVSSLIEDHEKVTAIPSKFAFRNEVEGDDRVYRSLHNATRYDPLKIGRKVDDAIENGTLTLKRAIKYRWHLEYNDNGLPLTLCHFHSNTNKENADIAKAISKQVVDGISVPVITFDQTGTKVYENGEHTRDFTKLKLALQELKDEEAKVVYMMGGQMCSRAFRVTSVDWDMYIGVLIYGWTDSSEASLIVQRMGRLCGLTKKELVFPQRVFAEKKTFYKAIDCTNATSELVKTAYENPKTEFADMKQMVTMGERLTNVKLSISGIEKEFQIDKDKEMIHGDIKEEDKEEDRDKDDHSSELEGLQQVDQLKYMLKHQDNGEWRDHNTWYNLTGSCGYSCKDGHHKAMKRLSKTGFVECKKDNNLVFRLKK